MSLLEQLRGRTSRPLARPPDCTCRYTASLGVANPGVCRVHSRPRCPQHAAEMRASRAPGVYFCPRKTGAVWCPVRITQDGELV